MRIDRLVLNQDTILRSIGLLLVLHCLSSGFWLPSQSRNAPLIGIVADPTGAVIPGTSASIIPAASQAAATGTADGLGSYHTRGLNPGSHIVTVSAPGSATSSSKAVTLDPGRVAQYKVVLRIRVDQQQVHVDLGTLTVDTTPNGTLGSPLLGKPQALIGGFFGNSTAGNRSIIFKTDFHS